MALLDIRCRESDLALSLELAADLAVQGLLVGFDRQQEVGPQRRPSKWCNSGGSAPATPGLTARLPQISAVAMGGPVCDPVRSTTTKPDHRP